MAKGINPIVVDTVGNGLRDSGQNALVAHRSRGISQPARERSNGSSLGRRVGGVTLKGSSV